jgi:hypothetical protein
VKTAVHQHSIEAYYDGLVESFPQRTRDILIALQHSHGPMTDRQIQEALELPERGCVQPRVTEAIQCGLLVEVGVARCRITEKNVRLVAIAPDPRVTQMEMSL